MSTNPTRRSVPIASLCELIADAQAEHTPDFREKMALFEKKCQSEAKMRALRDEQRALAGANARAAEAEGEQDNAQQGLDAEQFAETARHDAALVTEAERHDAALFELAAQHDAALRDFAARQQRIDQAKVEMRAAAVSRAKSLRVLTAREREDEGIKPPPVVHGRVAQIAAGFARVFVDGAETPTPQQPRKGAVVPVCAGGASARPMFASLWSAEAGGSKVRESPPRARSDDRGSVSPTIEMWSLPSAVTIPRSLPPAMGAPTRAEEAAVATVATTLTSLVDRIAVLEFEHEEENLGDIGSPMRNDAEREHVALTVQLGAPLVSSEEESDNGQLDLSDPSPTGARRLFAVDDSAGKDRLVGRGGSAQHDPRSRTRLRLCGLVRYDVGDCDDVGDCADNDETDGGDEALHAAAAAVGLGDYDDTEGLWMSLDDDVIEELWSGPSLHN